ncbi:YceI family protein [Streptomyces sp. NBC_01465]|uniref:YceI family protein n=1 Tax=Streptomyces sp. NBC_01465 TaxID=2903878 RepID=UPI002E303379|nr:YceI family protein [Streptomyces sp. NBC_01465]
MTPDGNHTTAEPPLVGRYNIDTGSSTVIFRTAHMFGLGPVRGTFAIVSGTADIAEPLAGSAVHVELDAASFTTGSKGRDGAIRSARFLDAAGHPTITYETGSITESTLTGTLTVRDVSQPVTLTIEEYAQTPKGFTARATTRIDRMAFGVKAARGMAQRHLDVELQVTFVR